MNSLVQIQVMVPQVRVGEFYEMFGRWLQAPPRAITEPESGVTADDAPIAPKRRSWTDGSNDDLLYDAVLMYRNLSYGAKKILDHLIDHADHKAKATDLARVIGLSSHNEVAGTLASFGFQSKAVKRRPPYEVYPAPHGATIYRLDAGMAQLFRSARDHVHQRSGAAKISVRASGRLLNLSSGMGRG